MSRAQLPLVRNTARYYSRRRRWRALARAMFATVVRGWDGELCQECGRGYHFPGGYWFAPAPLWMELVGRYGGLLCPRCFDAKATAAGYRLCWTPVVVCRDGVATSNHWGDPVRDRLLMGVSDPHYFDGGKVNDPQEPWASIGDMLGWKMRSYYPDENRAGGRSADEGVVGDAAAAALEEGPEAVADAGVVDRVEGVDRDPGGVEQQ